MCRKKTRIIKKYISFLILLFVLVYINQFRVVIVSGVSMEPTLKNRSIHLIKRESSYKRDDIIVFKKGNETIIKRIVAINNDKVGLREGKILINSVEQKYYIYDGKNIEYDIEPNQVFVLGDNTYNSVDSRNYGPIDIELIVGKIVV